MFGLGSMSAQSFLNRIYTSNSEPLKVYNSADTLKILAVMVDFQLDTDDLTFGNGKFGSIFSRNYSDPIVGDTIVDPLPYDANYFSSHLEFAKNYFKKVSGGKLNIAYNVLPQVITVSKIIRDYSPPLKSTDLTNLGKFAQEVWQLVSAAYPNIDFSKYNLFTIFHAGVGGDLKLAGSLGNERDLPSLYLGNKSLKKIFGDSFTGFPMNNGKFNITNTMILPSTESREQSIIGGKSLEQFSSNGIIVANIASYLGLPDLFNTETGISAIGTFGLMDGDAFFAYRGIFPPEPSPWEKIYLGWIQPVTLSVADSKVNLAAKLAAGVSDTTILKIPINSTEYFLIENRQRDVKKDGLNITYRLKGTTYNFNLQKDISRFNPSNIDSLKGVITDVDEFDWAVPGNGIVVWHIDENVISEKIADDKINADANRKGVYVEEADGIQDIGVKFTTFLGEDYGRATNEDFWYSGNPAKLYKNKFAHDTKPNTNSNSGANSLITLENFSPSSNKMSFNVRFGNESLKTFNFSKLNLPTVPNRITTVKQEIFNQVYYMIAAGNLYLIDKRGQTLKSYNNFSDQNLAAFYLNSFEYVVGSKGKTINILRRNFTPPSTEVKSFVLPSEVTSQIMVNSKIDKAQLYAGLSDGSLLNIGIENLWNSSQIPTQAIEKKSSSAITQLATNVFEDNKISFVTAKAYFSPSGYTYNFPSNVKKLAATEFGGTINIVLTEGNHFYIFKNDLLIKDFTFKGNSTVESFILTDLKNDLSNYIVFSAGSSIECFNLDGVSADNFPFAAAGNYKFTNVVLSAALNTTAKPQVFAFSDDGELFVIDGMSGKMIDGFPTSVGKLGSSFPIFCIVDPGVQVGNDQLLSLALVDDSNNFRLTGMGPAVSSVYWSSDFANNTNTSFVSNTSASNVTTEFFPLDKTYNWPNPVYTGETKIRYYVSENSNVKIKIVDLAGELVAQFDKRANGGFDNETSWDVSKVQSGVYYAHVEVTGDSGKTGKKIIKIAVIK